jgi:amino acid transporter
MRNNYIKVCIILILVLVLIFLFSGQTSLAKDSSKSSKGSVRKEIFGSLFTTQRAAGYLAGKSGEPLSLPAIIGQIISLALLFVGVIFMVLLIYGGFLWMTAGGNEEQVKKAKKLITNTAIGLVIVIAAYAITHFVISYLLPTSIQ